MTTSESALFLVTSFLHSASEKIREKLWPEANTRYNAPNIVPTFKSEFISLLVWTAFSAHGRITLVKIEGTLKKEKKKRF